MADATQVLRDLQSWYHAQCDEDWEHDYGITITSMDNPGWCVQIDLALTWLEQRPFPPLLQEGDDHWFECFVRDKQFLAYCGPNDLSEVLQIFLDWAKSVPNWLSCPPSTPTALDEIRREQDNWDAMKGAPQNEQCAHVDCARKRISLSVFCRRHHYEQIRKMPPPVDRNEVWLSGDEAALRDVKSLILDTVRNMYGAGAIPAPTDDGSDIVELEIFKRPIQLLFTSFDAWTALKIELRNPCEQDCLQTSESLLRLFVKDVVQPAIDTRGNVTIDLNFWKNQ
jgi:hypothetical protein